MVGRPVYPDARAHRREAQTRGLAPWVRPLRVWHGRRHGTVETLHRQRKSRRLFARFKSALATARAEYDIYNRIPAPARIDRTWDNGTEWIGYNVLNSPMRDE